MILRSSIVLFLFVFPRLGWSFPEMVRHGYVNCTACHLSPSGGGVLVPYGRELSKELLSTWSKEGEQNFAWGAVTLPEKLLVSAYLRGLQLYENTPEFTEAKVISMQADTEAAYNGDRFVVDGTLGRVGYFDSSGQERHRLFSRRHYAMARLTDQQNLRFGRFQNNFGIGDPNHELFVRSDLGFGNDTESYALEYSSLGENFSAYVSALFGNFHDTKSANNENGFSATGSYYFLDKNKVGVSYFYGDSGTATRNILGPWAILSFTDTLYLESELDFQRKTSSGTTQHGFVNSSKLAYEIWKGMIPFIAGEFSHLDLDRINTEKSSYGAGLQLFPRPHFELIAEWQKIRMVSAGSSLSDFAWIMANFYL